MLNPSPIERFWKKVLIKDMGYKDPCWIWIANKSDRGYAVFHFEKPCRAHRFAYEYFIGRVPEGLELDHLCRNRDCVNPSHCEAVTHKVNTLRGNAPAAIYARMTHCPKGHLLSGDNLYTRIRDGQPTRVCRECKKINGKLWMREKRKRIKKVCQK